MITMLISTNAFAAVYNGEPDVIEITGGIDMDKRYESTFNDTRTITGRAERGTIITIDVCTCLLYTSRNAAFTAEYDSVPVAEEALDEEPLYKIEKSKRFEIRPMSAEEAVMQMELLDHSFFVFRNDQTELINVVYKRKDGSFGLIEPE